MEKVSFSYERFCEYVRNKMSTIIQNSEGEYQLLVDTEAIREIIPIELEIMTETKALRYIYDNRLFEELEEVMNKNNDKGPYILNFEYDKIKESLKADRAENNLEDEDEEELESDEDELEL